jgi:hypothetical protein
MEHDVPESAVPRKGLALRSTGVLLWDFQPAWDSPFTRSSKQQHCNQQHLRYGGHHHMKTLFVSLAIAAASATCLAQCQSNRISLNQELHDAGTTMVGTVEAAQPVPDSSFHLDGIDYVVRVDRVIKGRMINADVVHIFSENSPTKFPMQTGKQYLLFVHRNFNDYEVDNCGNSGLLEASNIDSVAKLKEYARK